MTMLRAAFRELVGLFVEDGSLALEIIGIVIVAGVSATLNPLVGGAVLLLGCLGVLFENVTRAARRGR